MATYSRYNGITTSQANVGDDTTKEKLALMASQLICDRLGVQLEGSLNGQFRGEVTQLDPRVIKFRNFVLHVLRDVQLSDDVLFKTLLMIERLRYLRPHILKTQPGNVVFAGKFLFTLSYIVAESMTAAEVVYEQKGGLLGSGIYEYWCQIRTKIWQTARNFEKDVGLQAINPENEEDSLLLALDGNLSFAKDSFIRFKEAVIRDFGTACRGPFPDYARDFVIDPRHYPNLHTDLKKMDRRSNNAASSSSQGKSRYTGNTPRH